MDHLESVFYFGQTIDLSRIWTKNGTYSDLKLSDSVSTTFVRFAVVENIASQTMDSGCVWSRKN